METTTENGSDFAPMPQPSLDSAPPAASLPQYSEMIMAAIEALDDPNGSNKSAISKHIEDAYGSLPATHATLLSHHLNRMKQSGELLLVKNNYMKPDPNAPPKRGRGRPPKAKAPAPEGAVVSPPRPRGRPPKERDPSAPAEELKEKAPSSGRPRGRPPKKSRTSAPAPAPKTKAAAPVDGAPRGRGRPPKVKAAVTPIAC